MKYPKEWIDMILGALQEETDTPEKWCEALLNCLKEVGALKEPPKPRKFWIVSCGSGELHAFVHKASAILYIQEQHGPGADIIPFRVEEVLDD